MKKIIALLLSLMLVSLCSVSVLANDVKVVDEIDYLTEAEEQEISDLCNEFIRYTGMDCVVYITYQPGYDAQTLADDFYDHNGYGIGKDNDGIILCVNYGESSFGITTAGPKAMDTFTDYAQDFYIVPSVTDYLKSGDTFGACKEFVNQSLSVYRNYDYFHQAEPEPVEKTFWEKLGSASTFGGIIAAIVSMISYASKSGQLKSTAEKHSAGSYVTDAHINMSRSGEVYLYTNVLRRKIDTGNHGSSSRPSSHSSTHVSSSGVTHGGTGSHKF